MQSLGVQTMDQNLVACRKALNQKIYNFIQRNATSDELLRKAPEMAMHLEERVFNYVATRDDYINLVMDPAERHLQSFLMRYFAQKQPPSHHIATSSAYSTMIPTPGLSCNGSVGADISGAMDNHSVTTSSADVLSQTTTNIENLQQTANCLTDVGFNTSFNNQDGLISNGYQHQTSNYAYSSSGGGIVSSVATSNIPRQLPQMMPTPGFSNPQSLPSSSEVASGANFSSTDSTTVLTAAQQKKYAGARSNNMVQGLGGQIALGIRSNMAQKSSHGLSNGLANNGLDSIGNNMQHTGTVASEGLLGNSSYGSLKPMQQHFDQQHQQSRIPTALPQQIIIGDSYPVKSSDVSSSENFNGPGSILSSFSNLNSSSLHSKFRTNSDMRNHSSSLQQMQRSPHMRPQILDNQQKMILQSPQIMNDHLLQPQKQVQKSQQQSNQTYSQYAQNQPQLERQHSLHKQQLMLNNDTRIQAPLSSNFVDQIGGNAILTHPESLMSQTQQVQLSEFQSHYHQNTSFVDNSQIVRVLDNISGSQDFHAPVSQGSSGVLQRPHQQVDMFTSKVSFISSQPQTEGLLQDQFRTHQAKNVQILERNSGKQQLQEVLHQRIKGHDEAHQPCISGEKFISSATIIPQVSKASAETERSAQELDYRKQFRWLLLLWHARTCSAPKGQCLEAKCVVAQKCLMHMRNCESDVCIDHNCFKTKKLLKHYRSCKISQCPVCGPVEDHLTKNHTVCSPSLLPGLLSQTKEDPDRMNIDTVPVEAFDHMQALPKRMRIEDPSPTAVPSCETSPVSVSPMKEPDVCNEVKLYAGDGLMNISARFGVTCNMIHNQSSEHKKENFENSGSHTVGALSTAISLIDSVVPVQQENVLIENKKEHDSNLAKTEDTDPSADQVTAGKSGKPKIKAVSLTELFTPEQIRAHITGLRQWVGQTKAKAEKNQAMEHSMSENSCQLCAVEKLTFDPPPIYCSLCGGRIKRNAMYYTIGSGDTRNFFCIPCYNDVRSDSIEVDGTIYPKAKMEKKKNDEDTEEWWVQCDKCEAWQHQVCALFNGRRNDGGQAEYTCPNCCIEEIKRGERKPLPQSTVLGAKDLPRTILSDHIEQRLFRRLRHERTERAKHLGKNYDEVPGAEGLVVRVVSSVDKKLEVKPRFLEIFQEENYPKEFAYKSKAVLLFQKIEGVEVCLFGMYVQEFGSECAFPNQRRVYLSYLDSVKYFRPEIKTVSGEALRTFVYHEILIGYLEYCKKRGFTSCYIWACPPLKGEDYILYCHPEIQKTPKSDKLREWYLSMLRKASKENIVVELTNLYDHFFVTMGECKAKPTAARLPYFDGDYWPGAAEDMINQLRQEENGTNKQKKGKTKKIITKRALKAAGQTDLSGNASKDAMLMQKLGETISPMKEDFIMVHLQHCCNHCCVLMVSGTRWVCHQCKNFQLCDKCYEVERRIEDRERHPIHGREKHTFYAVEINDVQTDTKDQDEILESEFFDTRQAFLSLCQGNHYQYDTLRRAKHSSMMVLYHLHNPTAPAFVITCCVCHNDIETGQGWRCESCPDFDVCNVCYLKGGIDHPHKLTNHQSLADRDAQNKEARQQRVLQLRKMLDLLVHASQCRLPHCQYPNCRKVKGLFRHGIQCKIRVSGGCHLCKKMWHLLQLHARSCKESECIVPRCRDLKEHLRRLQQQSESRRRAAVMEMMRQRAAEVTGNN